MLLRIRFIGFLMSSCGGLLLLFGGGLLLAQFLGAADVSQSQGLTAAVDWFVAVAVTVVAIVLAVVGRWLELGQARGRWLATAIFALVFAAQFLPPSDFWNDLGIATLMLALIAAIHSGRPEPHRPAHAPTGVEASEA